MTTPEIHCAHDKVWPLKKFKPNPRNPNTHPAGQLKLLAKIITTQGWRSPITVSKLSGFIVKGHGRLEAAKLAGLTHAPVDLQDYATPEAEMADLIADNRLAELSQMDAVGLKGLIDELRTTELDIDLTGYDEDAVALLMAQIGGEEPPDVPAQMENAEQLNKKWQVADGDLWAIGPHRLLCGDARDHGDLARLFSHGEKIMVAVTSPPYASQRKYDEASGFKPIAPEDYVAWFDAVQSGIAAHLDPAGSFFLNIKEHCDDGQRHLYVKDLTIAHVRNWGWQFVDEFAWTHGGTPKGVKRRFKNGWEPIFQFTRGEHKFRPDSVRIAGTSELGFKANGQVGSSGSPNDEKKQGKVFRKKKGNVPHWNGNHPSKKDGLAMQGNQKIQRGSNADLQGSAEGGKAIQQAVEAATDGLAYPSNVLSVGKNREALGHGAAYPTGLPLFFINAFSDPADVVFDPFLGSGTTLVAAEQVKRTGYGCEISPLYCAVILQRMVDAFPALTIERLSNGSG